jgi:hypothetical protein
MKQAHKNTTIPRQEKGPNRNFIEINKTVGTYQRRQRFFTNIFTSKDEMSWLTNNSYNPDLTAGTGSWKLVVGEIHNVAEIRRTLRCLSAATLQIQVDRWLSRDRLGELSHFQCLSDYCRYKSLKSSILSDNIFLFSTVYSIRLDQTSELFFDPKDEYITLWLWLT